MPLENANLTDLFAFIVLIVTAIGLGVYVLTMLIVTAIRINARKKSPLSSRFFYHAASSFVLLLTNLLLLSLLSQWTQSHSGHYFRKTDDIYVLAWLPLNFVLVAVLGEIAYQIVKRSNRAKREEI